MDRNIHTKTGHSSYEKLLVACCAVCFACYFGSYMRIPVVPLFARSIGADTFHVGLINSSFLLMAGLLCLPLGILSDGLGRKPLIVTGIFITACSSFLLTLSETPDQMIGIYLLFGIGVAAFAPTLMSLVADISPPTHLGRSYGWYTTALYGGMSLGPAAGGFVAQNMGFIPVFFYSGAFILMILGVVFLSFPDGRSLRSSTARQQGSFMLSIRELLGNYPLVACWLVTLFSCFGLGMFITFIPLHAQDQGVSIGQIGLIFAIQALFNALSRIPFGYLSDKAAKRDKLVIAGIIGFSLSIVGLGIATGIYSFLFFAVGFGISMGVIFTAVGALIVELVHADLRGLAMGGHNACIYLGMMLSSAAMGAIIQQVGFRNAFLITALINIFSACFFVAAVTYLAKTKGTRIAVKQ
ncbi:MAG TPA: MFS transporter [Syntrophales bacterium]|nr:MFS transporter [Syntrophales bacterium]